MQEKVNGVYQPLYPQTYWQQVIGADSQIVTVNNRISTVQSNLQGQINQKQDASTAVNQGNFKNFVEQYTGEWVLLGQADLKLWDEIHSAEVVLATGTSLKNIIAFKQVASLKRARAVRSGGTYASRMYIGTLSPAITLNMASDSYSTYGASGTMTTYYRVVGDLTTTYGEGGSTNNYSYTTERSIYYAPLTSSGNSDYLRTIQVNPTTCALLSDLHGWSIYGINPVDYIEGNVAVYGLKTTQGEFL